MRFVSTSFQQSSSFYARTSGSESGSLISSSFIVTTHKDLGGFDGDFTNGKVAFTVPSQSAGGSADVKVLVMSASSNNPRIGVGTNIPLTSLDIRSVTASDSANIILRTNEDGVIQVGEETGRVIFAIESSSYLGTEFVASGSTAAIFSKVLGSGVNGAYGSLTFEVNDNNNVTEPVEAMTIGYGLGPSNTDIGFIISGAITTTAGANALSMKSSANGKTLAYLGYSGVEDLPELDRGKLLLNDDGTNNVQLNGPTGNSDFINTGNNVAIGTTTAPEKLTVEGNISASGDLIATNGSFSGDLTVDGNITANQYIVSSSVTYMTQSFSSGSTIFGDTLDDTHQFTGSILYTGSLDINGMTYPTTDGSDGQVIITDGDGALTFGDVKVYAQVKNISGVTLAKGTPVHATSSASPPAGNVSEVIAASASLASTMPATFILDEELANEAEGRALLSGFINGVDTSAFNEGDVVYVGGNGGYTNVKPTSDTNLIQNLGIVTKVDALNGSGFIYGSGRSNDIPNLPLGKIWVGSNTYSVTSSVIHLDESNNRLGINTDNPTYQLHVSSSTAALGVYERAGGAALYLEGQETRGVLGTVGTHPLLIAYNSGEVARFTGTSFLVTGSLDVSTSITASGNISASGTITANGATFTGNLIVTGSQLITDDITSDGTIRARVKSFDIPHPTRKGKRLVYGALEGPEHGIYCRGESKELKVLLPPEWRAMVDKKGISVQITPIGEWQPLYFKKLHSNWLYFGCGDDRENVHFYWEIKGERTDVPSLETVQ